MDRLNGGGSRGDHGEALGERGKRVFATTREQGEGEGSAGNGGRLWLGAARGEGEGRANGAGDSVGQALAFF